MHFSHIDAEILIHYRSGASRRIYDHTIKYSWQRMNVMRVDRRKFYATKYFLNERKMLFLM